MNLGRTDIRVLRTLQRDGRISNQDLADRVGLSASSCWRRVRDLEAAGIIAGYRATIDAEACGLDFHAFVLVELSRHEPERLHTFTDAIATRDEILDCFATTGDADYHLRVACRSKRAYYAFLEEFLFRIPVVSRVRTNLILTEIKRHGLLALEPVAG